MKKLFVALVLPLFILSFSSCARMQLSSAHLNNQVQLNPTSEPVKKHFKESVWNHYFIFQLVPTSEPNISEMLASHIAPGDKVVGLKVGKKMTFLNGLVCALVGVIYCPETTTIEGDVVAAE